LIDNAPALSGTQIDALSTYRQRSLQVDADLTRALTTAATAQDRRGTRLWNLTRYTVTNVQLSPPGQHAWGKNQCENDKDGTVDHGERLRITGITSGLYDIKLGDKGGRVCIV